MRDIDSFGHDKELIVIVLFCSNDHEMSETRMLMMNTTLTQSVLH